MLNKSDKKTKVDYKIKARCSLPRRKYCGIKYESY